MGEDMTGWWLVHPRRLSVLVFLLIFAPSAVAWAYGGVCLEGKGALPASVLQSVHGKLDIYNPRLGAVLPADLGPLYFDWEEVEPGDSYVLELRVGSEVYSIETTDTQWTPGKPFWNMVRAQAAKSDGRVDVSVYALNDCKAEYRGQTYFVFSPDAFDAKLVCLRIPLPFLHAQDHPELNEWVLVDPASAEEPRVILRNLPYCANCHAFSPDGRVFGLDIDYRKDKGGYAVAEVRPGMRLTSRDIRSWTSYNPGEPGLTMGLFTKLSPDGRYAMGTVKEKSFFIPIPDVDYSQLFFPIRGHLAWFARKDGVVRSLPGADSRDFVQTGPAWSPDGATIAFSRAPLPQRLLEIIGDRKFLPAEGRVIEDMNKEYPMLFDLWSIPFNGGKGGVPTPVKGASENGRSNYFPRYTPDGRFIVYVQSDTGLVMQPSSRLWIVPAEGGTSHELECNTETMNSWHSLSPNGRWIAFSSKADSSFTGVYLAHLDEQGHSAPPVYLQGVQAPERASIIPEAVPAGVDIRSIRLVEP